MQFTRSPSRQYSQCPQLPPRKPTPTRSPTAQPSTSLPIASIRPTASWPGTLGHWIGNTPSTVAESEWHTPQASTRMRTWPAGGSTSGFSVSSSLPLLTACTARYVEALFMICFLFLLSRTAEAGIRSVARVRQRERSAKAPSVAAADLAQRRIGAALPLPMGDTPRNVVNAKELGLPALVKRKHPLSVRIETSGSCDGVASQSLL